jgi:hypothetical protein
MTPPNEPQTAFQHAGLSNVVVTFLTIRMDFESFEDFWIPALFGQGTHSEFFAGRAGHLTNAAGTQLYRP